MERNFQTEFNKWLKAIHYKTGAFELKVSDGSSLPFDHVQDHQETALYAAKHGNFVYKIPDLGNQNPFDCLMLVHVPSWVVVMYHHKDFGQREFYMIDIDMWMEEKRITDRKSLTEERAGQIGKKYTL